MKTRVFISSTCKDLQPEREAVAKALSRMRGAAFSMMECFGSRSEDPEEVCLGEVDRCQFYVGIIAHRYGSGVTEKEYRRAMEWEKISCFIYFHECVDIPEPHRESDPDNARKLKEFKQELKERHHISWFKNADHLATLVVLDLHNHLLVESLSSMKRIVKATRGLCKARELPDKRKPTEPGKSTGGLRNRYRYSLGVAIDNLAGAFGPKPNDDFPEEGPWPCLVEPSCFKKRDEDRWSWFQERVEPVVRDIKRPKYLHPLEKSVIELCDQMEYVVGELDAILEVRKEDGEAKLIELNKYERIVTTTAAPDQVKQRLKDAYKPLYDAWHEWLRLIPLVPD